MSGWSDASFRTLCSNPHSQTQKKPETAFHKRPFRAFSQFRPIKRSRSKIKLAFCAFGGRINLSQAINLYL